MSDFDTWPTIGPQQLLMRQMQQQGTTIAPPNSFDPYQALLKRKQKGEDTTLAPVQEFDPNDMFELQEFCKQHGIVGFNMGRMNPKAALKILKARIGIKETPTPPPSQKTILLG